MEAHKEEMAYKVHLILEQPEAEALRTVVVNIAGSGHLRMVTNAIFSELSSLGVRPSSEGDVLDAMRVE